MACIMKRRCDSRSHFHGFAIFDRFKQWQCLVNVGTGVQGNFRMGTAASLFPVPFLFVRCVFFLDVGGIAQHDVGQVHRRSRCQDGRFKSIMHEFRYQAAVVDMNVRQQHLVDLAGDSGNGSQFLAANSRSWNIPQSIMICVLPTCKTYLDPVTWRLAPKNLIFIFHPIIQAEFKPQAGDSRRGDRNKILVWHINCTPSSPGKSSSSID